MAGPSNGSAPTSSTVRQSDPSSDMEMAPPPRAAPGERPPPTTGALSEDEQSDLEMENGTANGKGKNRARVEEDMESSGEEGEEETMFTQSAASKRNIAARLRQHGRAVQDTKANLGEVTVESMTRQIQESDLLFSHVRGPAQAVLDSRTLIMQSDMGATKARQLKLDSSAFDTDEFLTRCIALLASSGAGEARVAPGGGGDDSDSEKDQVASAQKGKGRAGGAEKKKKLEWDALGQMLGRHSRRVPSLDFMYGTLSIEMKVKKVRAAKAREKIDESQRVQPEEITAADMEKDDQETTRMVANIGARLQAATAENAIPYLKFVVNPHSYAQTIENMFYFSFLVKEGKAAIEIEEEEGELQGEAIAFRCEAANETDIANGATKSQIVTTFDIASWKAVIEAYEITESIIPDRAPKGQMRKDAKWY